LYLQNSCNIVYPGNMFFRYIILNILHKCYNKYTTTTTTTTNNNNNNNNNYYYYYIAITSVISELYQIETVISLNGNNDLDFIMECTVFTVRKEMTWSVLTWTLQSQGFILKSHVRCSCLVSEFILCLLRYDQFGIINVYIYIYIYKISFFFFFHWHYSQLWVLACRTMSNIIYIYIYIW